MSFSYQLIDNSAAILQALESATKSGLTEIGERAVDHARERVPVDAGTLRDSITSIVDDESVTVGSDKDYAVPVETGTYKMAARPYLKPAMTDHNTEYEKIMKNALENA